MPALPASLRVHGDRVPLSLRLTRGPRDGPQGLGNNIFPAIPELGDVMASPKIDGALRSLLGDHCECRRGWGRFAPAAR